MPVTVRIRDNKVFRARCQRGVRREILLGLQRSARAGHDAERIALARRLEPTMKEIA